MKQLLPLALALALTLAGCGAPSGEALPPQPSEGVETAAPIPTLTPSAKPIPTDGPYVYTDYSKLEDNVPRPNVYERWHGEFTDHLIPSPDYGHLLPFSGSAIADEWGGEYDTYALDGLMTLEGKVVGPPMLKRANKVMDCVNKIREYEKKPAKGNQDGDKPRGSAGEVKWQG